MLLKFSLLTLSSVIIMYGGLQLIANQSVLASQLRASQLKQKANLVSSTTFLSNQSSCTSTSTSRASCTSTSRDQSVPSSSERSNPPASQDEQMTPARARLDENDGSSSSSDNQSNPSNSSNSSPFPGDHPATSSQERSNSSEMENEQSTPLSSDRSNLSNSNTSSTSDRSTESVSAIEQDVHKQINKYRVEKGLPALTLDENISEQARAHSQNMGSGTVAFSHDGFQQRIRALSQEIPNRGSAENVAFNRGYSDPVTKVVEGWIDSPSHRQNIEGNYSLTGIGVAQNAKGEYYFTQIFIRGNNTQK